MIVFAFHEIKSCHKWRVQWRPLITEQNKIEPPHDKTNEMACAPSGESDRPGHPPSLMRVFAVRMKKPRVFSYPLSTSEDSDQTGRTADLSLRWAHMPFCWFYRAAAQTSWSWHWKFIFWMDYDLESGIWLSHGFIGRFYVLAIC